MASDKIKGNSARVLHVPGYNIHSENDLHQTRMWIFERKHRKKGFSLSLGPMVDMFSILVIYLLMNFSTTGEVFFVGKNITIPISASGIQMESLPLISIVKNKVLFETEESAQNPESVYVEELNDGVNPQLRNKLKQIRQTEIQIRGAQEFKGQVNIQADISTEIEEVKKVMRILIEEGWTGINFIVEPKKK